MRKSGCLTGTTFANVIGAFSDADSMASLRVNLPNQKGEMTHVLAGARITIGRRPDNTIQIIDKSVSGHHAELIAVKGH
jgi:pSer/pThr/pTyr-binding forkhead associated (FHA) protein